MIDVLGYLAAPFLRALAPERAHALTIQILKLAPPFRAPLDPPSLAVRCFGLDFPNPLGMAAGFDKNAEVHAQLLGLGFGFTEVGTVTPLPQFGNPQPRMFRLLADGGIINRLGFNGQGHAATLRRLEDQPPPGIVGVNIGANKDTCDRMGDYVAGIRAFAQVASYFTVNVSSPNTPGLRDLQAAAALDELLVRVLDVRDACHRHVPVLLKIAPDVSLAGLDDIVRVARARRIDGMIVSNTTLARPTTLQANAVAKEAGGLSGRPLFELSTAMLAATFLRVERQFPLVGVGGIHDAASAWTKIEAGADLLQLYSALVFQGIGLVGTIKRGLLAKLQESGAGSLAKIVGRGAPALAAR